MDKQDPNTEAFQMRAQWAKANNCKKQWAERWSWLLDERKDVVKESEAVRREHAQALSQIVLKTEITKSLKPVPQTSTGIIGWLSTRDDCQLEIYKSWLVNIPLRVPDAWDDPNYDGKEE